VVVRNTNTQAIPGLPILLERDPYNSAGFSVKSADYASIESWTGENYTQINISPSTNPAYVDQSGILVGLPIATDPPSATVFIPAFYYWGATGLTAFAAVTTTTLLGSLPAAAFSKWITVSVDIATNAYTLTAGADFANDSETPTAFFPAVPSGDIVLGDVRIESSTTAIGQNQISGLRRALLDSGSYALPVPTAAGQILISLDGATWSAAEPLAGDNGEIVTDNNGDILVSG
jgi:hypothetical protein